MGKSKPRMTRALLCFLVSSLTICGVRSTEYSDSINQGYSVASSHPSSTSSSLLSSSSSLIPSSSTGSLTPSASSSSTSEIDELQSAAQYQQPAYSNGPVVNSVASSVYAGIEPVNVADSQQKQNYNNYGYSQQIQTQAQPQQQPQQQFQPQPIYQVLNYPQNQPSQQYSYDQQNQLQQQQPQLQPQLQPQQQQPQPQHQHQQPQQQQPQPLQQSIKSPQLNYGENDYDSRVAQNTQSDQNGSKKTVILAIPVKLALQLPENKNNLEDAKQQQQQPIQQSNGYSGQSSSSNYPQSSRPYDGPRSYNENGLNEPKNGEYRAPVNSPVYNPSPSYEQSSSPYDSNSQSYSSSSGKGSPYNRANQYDTQQKDEYKSNNNNNNNYPYVQVKESNYKSKSNSYENEAQNKEPTSESDGFDDSYEGSKSSDSYKGNNYNQNKEDSYPSTGVSSSSYDDENDDNSYSNSGSKTGPSKKLKLSPYASGDGDPANYGSKQKITHSDYPQMISSYDNDHEDWQSSYSGKGRGKKGSSEKTFDLSSYSSDDSHDDSDSKGDSNAAMKDALANYGSTKGSSYENNSPSGGIKVINDYSALKDYENLKDLGSLSFGGSKDYGGIKSLPDYGGSFKDHLSSIKDYAMNKERTKKINFEGSDSLDDYDSGSTSSASYSTGNDSPLHDSSSSLSSLRPSKFSLSDPSYDQSSYSGSIPSDNTYEISSPPVPEPPASGHNYGSSDVMLHRNPSHFTISDAVNLPENSFPAYPSPSMGLSGPPSYGSADASVAASAVAAATAAAAAAAGATPSLQNLGHEGYNSNSPLDFSSLYGSMMKSYSSPLYSPSDRSPLNIPYHQQHPSPHQIQVINTYSPSAYPALPPPSGHHQHHHPHLPPPPYGVMFGKPNNNKQPTSPSKYSSNPCRRFPSVTSPLALYKCLQGLSSITSPGKFSASSIFSSLYSSGSSPAKFVLKNSGKGSGLFGSLRLSSAASSLTPTFTSPPSSSSNKKTFSSPFKLDNIFGQIYKLL